LKSIEYIGDKKFWFKIYKLINFYYYEARLLCSEKDY